MMAGLTTKVHDEAYGSLLGMTRLFVFHLFY